MENRIAARKKNLRDEFVARIYDACSQKDWPMAVALAECFHIAEDVPGNVFLAIGFAYCEMRKWECAIRFLREALRRGIDAKADCYRCLGIAEKELSHFARAYACYCRAQHFLSKDGKNNRIDFMNILAERSAIACSLGRMDLGVAIGYKLYQMAQGLDEKQRTYSRWLFQSCSLENDVNDMFRNCVGYGKLFQGVQEYHHFPRKRKKLRIGYISPDFCSHALFRLFFPLITFYDKERYELCGYYMGREHDGCTSYIKRNMTVWRDVPDLPFEEIAKIIYEDEVDILVELAGHTLNTGLPVLAWKPAPIQVTALAPILTTGLPTVDYIITDRLVDPPERGTENLIETPIRLTGQWCYAGSDAPPSLGAPFMRRGFLTLGSFNQYAKLTDRMILLWREIMEELPDARLLIHTKVFEEEGILRFARKRLERLGIPMERVTMEADTKETPYMKRYLDVDIALDPYPYVGGVTTCDALFMGVPVVSCYGERRGSRFGLSLLQSVGVGELAVTSFEEYKERVLSLARDPELLNLLHKNLRTMMRRSPLMDMEKYVREWENFFEKAMKLRWRKENDEAEA